MCRPSIGVVPDDPASSPGAAVWYSGSAHTFAAGKDVAIGRDIRADLRIADPLISGAHLVLRFDEDHSVAVDNASRNGMFVKGRQVATVEVEDGQKHQRRRPSRAAVDLVSCSQAPGPANRCKTRRGRSDWLWMTRRR